MQIFSSFNPPSIAKTVNSVGKYLYKNLDGAYDFKKSSNMYDVYTTILYQIPYDIIKKYNLSGEATDVREMDVNISITYYDTKIRVNLIEISPEEVTLGHKTFDVSKLQAKDPVGYFNKIINSIMSYLKICIEKRYSGYEFLF